MSVIDEDDDFDMFAPVSDKPADKAENSKATNVKQIKEQVGQANRTEDLKDSEGYFRAPPGTVLKGKYTVMGDLGSGVFSTVYFVKAKVDEHGEEATFAAKVLRANETMYKAGLKELDILRKISDHPHLIKLTDSFDLDASNSASPHLVLVFERMNLNLRETLNKFGRDVGISIEGVRAFGRQLLSALAKLKSLGIVHADFKPDNILVSQDLKRCVLGDFGSAFYLSEPRQATPYIVSRYYRAPEIILGFEDYGCEMDMWSLGVTLFELYTGQVLFGGQTNNEMLDMMQTRIGKFPMAIIKRHIVQYERRLEFEPHFESDGRFKRHETDPVTKKIVRRLVKFTQDHAVGQQSLKGLIVRKATEEGEDDVSAGLDENVLDFADALEKCLALDPAHRIDPADALVKLKFFSLNVPQPTKRTKVSE